MTGSLFAHPRQHAVLAKTTFSQIIPGMVESDANSLAVFIETVWQLITGVLRLDPGAYRAVLAAPNGWKLALAILLVASLSYTLGQSVVLFANRVNRRHFIFALAISALSLAISVLFWAGSIWLSAVIIFDVRQPFEQILSAVAISFAPLLFGFLILIPYLGNIIFVVLRIWVFLAIIVGVRVTFQFGFWEALLCSILGWLVLELLMRIPFLQVRRFSNWLWRLSTGTDKQLETGEIVAQFVDQATPPAEETDEA